MATLDHWHPVLLSSELRSKPVAVELAGEQLVLFRTETGKLGALKDNCPHRRMKLSHGGKVIGEKLQCSYHGWTFGCKGEGESPATPKLYACAESFEVREERGALWVRAAGSNSEFPAFNVEGYFQLGPVAQLVEAPLELVVDNFCEMEHTATTHAMFGYPLERMSEVVVKFEPDEQSVHVTTDGPTKHFNPFLHFFLRVGYNYTFRDSWTTKFSPVHNECDHWWEDMKTGKEGMIRWRLYIFFVPRNDRQTTVLVIPFTKSRFIGWQGGARLWGPLVRRHLKHELGLDAGIMTGLADKDTGIEGMILSRFDKVIGLNRERIERVYRNGPLPPLKSEPASPSMNTESQPVTAAK